MKLRSKLAGLLLAGALLKGVEGKAQTNIVEGPITNNITTTIRWRKQHLLDVQRSGDGWYIAGSTNGWYNTNDVAQITAQPSNSAAKVFSHWTGQTNTTENPLNLPMTIAWTNLTPVFTDRTYTWTINSPYIGVDGFQITPGTTNWPYGSIATNTLNKTIINLEPGKRAVYKGYQTQEGN